MAAIVRSATSSFVASGSRPAGVKVSATSRTATRMSLRKTAAPAPSTSPASKTATRASPMEVAQIASEASFITGTALTMVAMTLVGLALGFVLLRVESLVQEEQK
ncbi:chloroplast cytochrome b6f 4.6 kDa subunit [Haematococcus lacustris]